MKKLSSIIFFSFLLTTNSLPQWVQMPGPNGMRINVFYNHNNIIFAGTKAYGVYRSTDNGGNWNPVNSGIEHTSVWDIISSGNNLLASIGSSCGLSNVYKSTDEGLTWLPATGLNNKIVSSFAVKDSSVYAVTSDFTSSVYRSDDDGNSWYQIASPIRNGNKIFISGDAIIVSDFNFIWRSTDNGISWDLAEQFALSGIWSFVSSGNKLFAAATTGLFTSTDNGASWTYSNFPGGASTLSSIGNTIYLGSGNVSKSTDAGATWNIVSSGLGEGNAEALFYDGTNVYAGLSDDSSGVYITTNGGAGWFASSNGFPPGSTVRSMISMGNFVFSGMQGNGVFRSVDEGFTWSRVGLNNDSLRGSIVFGFCSKNGMLFAGAQNGVYKSLDDGISFTRITNGFPGGGTISVYSLTVSNGNILVSGNVTYTSSSIAGIFLSSDDGLSWTQRNFPAETNFISSIVSEGDAVAYAGSYGNSFSTTGLYKSTDGGLSWQSRTFSINADIDILAVKGQNVLAGNLFGSFYSLDGGETFGPSLIQGGGVFTYTLRDNFIFAGNQEGMFYSINGGATFTDANSGFVQCPRPAVEASCSTNRFLFAGANINGLWRRPLSDFGISDVNVSGNENPSGFKLFQNYPNPFNPVTKISYSLANSGRTVLKIYDLLGNEIAALTDEDQAAGLHTVEWNAANQTSGIYFYRLFAKGNLIDTKKMMLLK